MKRLIVLLALLIGGCCPQQTFYHSDEFPNTMIELRTEEIREDGFHVELYFHENTEYEGVIQVLFLQQYGVVVEYFKLENGHFPCKHHDHHTGVGLDIRRMLIYPANVEGVDYKDDYYAMLPEDKLGNQTNAGPYFNEEYQKEYEVRGRVTAFNDSQSVSWTLEYKNGKLHVVIPGIHLVR